MIEQHVTAWVMAFLAFFSLPRVGLPAVFVISLVSATLLPMGSEPAVFAFVKLQPQLFWAAIIVATAGNTLGGAVDYWMGYGTKAGIERFKHQRIQTKALAWLERLGPKACLLSWLPLIGDPLCAVAGWLRLPFWPCVLYMAIGKCLRYITMTAALLWIFPNAAP